MTAVKCAKLIGVEVNLYRQLRSNAHVNESEIMQIVNNRLVSILRTYTRKRELAWRRLRPDMTWRWAGTRLPGLLDVNPQLAEIIAQILFGFDVHNFDVYNYTPRLDYNEIVLHPGERLRIERIEHEKVEGGKSLVTCTAKQL